MRRFSIRLATILSIGLLVTGIGATAATADPDSPYASQAQALGLTTAQATELQNQVDAYRAKLGGVQVAINKIQLDGAQLLVTLPGEAVARDITISSDTVSGDATSTDASITQHSNCPYYNFCAYSQTGYYGDTLLMYYCRNYTMPWSGYGSYYNNQTLGTRATFKYSNGSVHSYSVPAPGGASSIYWTPIWYVKPC